MAIVAAALAVALPDFRAYPVLAAVCVLLLDALWLTPRQKGLRESAAKIQERFDCDVLGLEWNNIKCGNPEPCETVIEHAARYEKRAHDLSPLTDWYPKQADRLPLELARLVCQRSNCWWDACQRRRYAFFVATLLLLSCAGIVWAGLAANLSVHDTLLFIALPLLPTVRLATGQWREHRDAADRLDRLRERLDRAWKEALGNPDPARLSATSRQLQDELFDNRKRNPPVFDALFKRLRGSLELQMNHGAAEMAGEAGKAMQLP